MCECNAQGLGSKGQGGSGKAALGYSALSHLDFQQGRKVKAVKKAALKGWEWGSAAYMLLELVAEA